MKNKKIEKTIREIAEKKLTNLKDIYPEIRSFEKKVELVKKALQAFDKLIYREDFKKFLLDVGEDKKELWRQGIRIEEDNELDKLAYKVYATLIYLKYYE